MGVDPGEGSTEDGHGVEIESVGARHAVDNACPKSRISSVGGVPGTPIRLASTLAFSSGSRASPCSSVAAEWLGKHMPCTCSPVANGEHRGGGGDL